MDWKPLVIILLRVALTYLTTDENENGVPDILEPFLKDSPSEKT